MPAPPKHAITGKQVGFLKRLAAKVFHGDDDDYTTWLRETFPRVTWSDPSRPSCKDLSKSQGITAIDDLKARAEGKAPPTTHRGRYHGAGQAGFAYRLTPDQADEVARYQDLLGWDAQRLADFVEQQVGKRALVSALTKRQAGKVITGMQRTLDDRNQRDADDRLDATLYAFQAIQHTGTGGH